MCLLLPSGECYDPELPQDHTGQQFNSRPARVRGDPRRNPHNFMRSAAWLECPKCKADDRFQILAEDDPRGNGMMQIYCSKCHDAWPVMQMHQPQMNNDVAAKMGYPTVQPDVVPIEFDLEMEGD